MIRCSAAVTHSTLVGTVDVMSHLGAFSCECTGEYDRAHLTANDENTRPYSISVEVSFSCLNRAFQSRSTLASLTNLHSVAHMELAIVINKKVSYVKMAWLRL